MGKTPEAQEHPELGQVGGRSTAAFVARHDFPWRIGEIEFDEDGAIRRRDSDVPLNLGFAYRGVEFHAEVQTGSAARVKLTADLGKLPYSVELGEGRRLSRWIIDASAVLPRGRIHLSDAHDMRLVAESAAPAPLTPVSLMATVAVLVLDFRPYLDLLSRALCLRRHNGAAAG